MALVRILVDGFSLLHRWPELAPGKPRFCSAAREELISRLTQYHDACRTPLTIVFDGARSSREPDETPSSAEVEVLYSRAGQTADSLIERATARLKDYGEVLVVTDDRAEQDMVTTLGGMTSSCENFIRMVQSDLSDLERELRVHNEKERSRFRIP